MAERLRAAVGAIDLASLASEASLTRWCLAADGALHRAREPGRNRVAGAA